MDKIREAFEEWISNGDEEKKSELEMTEDGRFYLDHDTDRAWYSFKSGYVYGATKDD